MRRWLAALAALAGLAASPLVATAAAPAAAADALTAESEVGPVHATVKLEPAAPRIGDPLRLTLEVVAEPQVELLMPEFGEALDRFRIVDFAPHEGLDDQGRTVATQVYTLQSDRSGPQYVPPLLVEFVDRRPGRPQAPEGEDAYELLTERLDFEVASVLPTDDALELKGPLPALPPRRGPGRAVWPWLAGLALALAAVAPFAWRRLRALATERRRESAYQRARKELDALLYGPRPSGDALDGFYVKLSGIVRHYLEDRFGLHSPEQTTDEFLASLADSPDLVRSHQDLLREFLHGADLVKFAQQLPDEHGVQSSIDQAQRFLEVTREGAGA